MLAWFRCLFSTARGLDDHVESALQFRIEADYDSAIREYGKAIAINDSLALAYYGRGYCFYAKDDYRSAARDFDTGLQLNSTLKSEYSRYIKATQLQLHPEKTFNRQHVLQTIEETFPRETRQDILTELDSIRDDPPFPIRDHDEMLVRLQLSILIVAADDGKFIVDRHYRNTDWRDIIYMGHEALLATDD